MSLGALPGHLAATGFSYGNPFTPVFTGQTSTANEVFIAPGLCSVLSRYNGCFIFGLNFYWIMAPVASGAHLNTRQEISQYM